MSIELNYSFGNITQLGKGKDFNTDTILEFAIDGGHVFLVCDGHDGEQGHGALAAKLTAESIKKYFFNKSYKDIAAALTNAVTFANYSVYEQAQKNPKYKGMGATLAILIYKNKKVYYAYAGDSRLYLYSSEKLKPLTLDHVENKFDPASSKVSILIGSNKDIKFGVCKNPLEVKIGDKYILTTDGLTDVINNDEITEVISDPDTSPDHKAMILAKKVDENAGVDNVSMHVVEFDNTIPAPKKKIDTKKVLLPILGILIATAIIIGGIKGFEYLSSKKKEKPVDKEIVHEEKRAVKTIENPVDTQRKDSVKKIQAEKDILKQKPTEPKPSQEFTQKKATYDHKIQYGENLYRLSLRYGVSQQQLINLNGDKAEKLIAGTVIKIPVRAVHVVEAGESFSVLSDKYNIKIDLICRANKLQKTQALSKGKKLVIPHK